MIISDEGLESLTMPSEGLRLTAYPDPQSGGAPWSIGYGHTLDVQQGDTCTQEQAKLWLKEDIQTAENEVNNKVTAILSQHQFDAVVDFVYNIGVGNFINSTMLKKLNNNDMVGASEEFNKWIYHALPGTVVRRQKETDWFNQGD